MAAKRPAPPNLLTIPVIRSTEQMANKTDLIGGLDRSSVVVDAEPAERVCASLGKFKWGSLISVFAELASVAAMFGDLLSYSYAR